ncbi:hypothetical protein ACFFHF_11885 [Robertmurraya beringensis]|uniref:Uncharacterized protein n=1 Tax=Robertmurraya beringensis TaxID=641660 RepID=A0ABV6KRJ4_9BACI
MSSPDAISTVYWNLFSEQDQMWAEASVKDLMKKMRSAYDDPELCKQKGLQGRADMLQFSWDHAGFALMRAIEKTIQ